MKYLKVTTRRGSAGQNKHLYPAPYDAQEVDRNKIGPLIMEGGMRFGEDAEDVLMLLSDSVADAYAAGSADMEILTEAQADAWLLAARNVTERFVEERVRDERRMQAILVKQNAGIELSAEDLRALDPDDSVPGINRTPKTAAAIFSG